jgi:hypothetical protein
LERDFLRKRFAEVPVDREAYLKESALSQEDFTHWMVQNKEKIASYKHALQTCSAGNVLELTLEMADGKRHMRRVLLPETPDVPGFLGSLA